MEFVEVIENKKNYLELLLIGDEQESMIDGYLDDGRLYVLYDEVLVGLVVVNDDGDSVIEIKNIEVYPEFRRCGYGSRLIEYVENKYKDDFNTFRLSTGDSPNTKAFYENNGFKEVGREKDYFIHNYDKPIYECGKLLKDMVYMEKILLKI